MRSVLRKLLFSNISNEKLGHEDGVLSHQLNNVKGVWNNECPEHSNAILIERWLKILLILSQFFFPGIYIRAFMAKRGGKLWKNFRVELQVILKLVVAYYILNNSIYETKTTLLGYNIILLWCWWMILETVCYTATLVFSDDVFAKPHSHKRNVILLIIDYVTLNLDFSTIYLATKSLKTSIDGIVVPVQKHLDAMYFSFISSLTIGYGDITAGTDDGKRIIILQVLTFLLFGVLFINFYTSRLGKNNS